MKNIQEIITILDKKYPDADIALDFKDVFQLLVVVILSAQCTDKQVNKISPELFRSFPAIKDFAECEPDELEKFIHSTGFYKNKAKNIKAAAQMILSEFGGKVPDNMKDLLKLPGIARKSANVILSSGYGNNEGIVVDTHVIRLSGLLGLVPKKLSKNKDAVKIEENLIKIVPKMYWGKFSHLLIHHGRNICIARRPKCDICPLNHICPSAFYWK
ncbi:endonuclease III [Candidatus Peregrinibacteria bacterium]|nr:endonuclease III [Candidatus Peregrinibacteria bacterium]